MPVARPARPRRAALVVALLLSWGSGAAPGAAAESVLARYWAHSGSLPPEFAWSFEARIGADGTVTARHCRGYAAEGPDCRTAEGRAAPEALAALRAAAERSGLGARPAATDPLPPVGGPGEWGRIELDGVVIGLPADPAEADRARVAQVLAAIRAALPPEVMALGDGG